MFLICICRHAYIPFKRRCDPYIASNTAAHKIKKKSDLGSRSDAAEDESTRQSVPLMLQPCAANKDAFMLETLAETASPMIAGGKTAPDASTTSVPFCAHPSNRQYSV